MKEELDEDLCNKFPKIFRDRHASMQNTCMCWGFNISDGWYDIMRNACAAIQWHIDQTRENNIRARWNNRKINRAIANGTVREYAEEKFKGWAEQFRTKHVEDVIANPTQELWKVTPKVSQFIATQVKEKFGSLRFYYQGGDDFTDGVVRMAELMSGCTCESCGKPGHHGGKGWITVLCDQCRGERENETT